MQKSRAAVFIILIISTQFAVAQIVGSNVFLKGNYVEIGVNQCGAYGTPVLPPTGYHPSAFLYGLGFVADSDLDGWTTGTPQYCGDYFIPGSPVEGWGFQIGAATIKYNTDQGCYPYDIPGSITGYSYSAGEYIATWEGDFTTVSRDLHFTQETILNEDETYFLTRVTICNNHANDVNDFYYMRNVDPDQDQPWSGDFTTYNEVIYQQPTDGQALITSEGLTYGCFLGTGSKVTNSRVTYGNFWTNTYGAKAVYDGTSYYYQSGSQTGDIANSIAFYYASIPSEECVCLSFAYILDVDDLDEALDATLPVAFLGGGIPYATGDTIYVTAGEPIDLVVAGLDGYTYTWTPPTGLSSTTGTTVTATVSTITTYSVTGSGPNCGDLYGTITLIPTLLLPVELVSFSGQYDETSVELKWETASENNTDKFVIEKSFDCEKFIPLVEIPASGFSNNSINYGYSDEEIYEDLYYYRLKAIDLNNSTKYSDIISVECKTLHQNFEIISASLKNNILSLSFNVLHEGEYALELYDMNAQNILYQNIESNKGIQNLYIPTENILIGKYYLITITDKLSKKQTAKKIISK
ncbi:MAG: hypothetical protein H7Y00_06545 [Fimbriimonadaceae bacterium]|nr:hypothetical protein [Chitinophagales bacterium]